MTDPTSFAPMKVPVTNSNVEQCRRVPRWRYADTAFLLGSGGTEVSQPEFTEQFNDGAGVRNMALEPLLALGDLVAAPMGSDRVEDILHGLPQIAVGVVRGAEAASLTLIGADGAPTTPVFTSVLAQGMDAVQYQAKEGPCLEAATAEQWTATRTGPVTCPTLLCRPWPVHRTGAGQ